VEVRMIAVYLYRHRTCRENTGQAWIARIDSGRIIVFQVEFFSWQYVIMGRQMKMWRFFG
jgi:hypothetical protein